MTIHNLLLLQVVDRSGIGLLVLDPKREMVSGRIVHIFLIWGPDRISWINEAG